MGETQIYKYLETYLNKIIDLERAHRKMTSGRLHPADLSGLINSYDNIVEVLTLLTPDNQSILTLIPGGDLVDKFMVLINEIKNDFNLDECKANYQDKITGNIFNEGVYPEIDEICAKIAECHANFDSLKQNFIGKVGRGYRCDFETRP